MQKLPDFTRFYHNSSSRILAYQLTFFKEIKAATR